MNNVYDDGTVINYNRATIKNNYRTFNSMKSNNITTYIHLEQNSYERQYCDL